jgi:hypothetical protein
MRGGVIAPHAGLRAWGRPCARRGDGASVISRRRTDGRSAQSSSARRLPRMSIRGRARVRHHPMSRVARDRAPGSARGVPVFGKCQPWPSQLVVVGGARSRGRCPCPRDAERACPGSRSTRYAKSSAAELNEVLRLRRSGDVVLQHDLLLKVRRTEKTLVTENVAWKILLAQALTRKGGFQTKMLSNQNNVRQQNVAAHRESHLALVPHPSFASGVRRFWQNPEVARHARPCAVS